MAYWAIPAVYGSVDHAHKSTSAKLLTYMRQKEFTPSALSRLSGASEQAIARLVNEGKGDLALFSQITRCMGMRIEELVPMPNITDETWAEIEARMNGEKAGFKKGTGGDKVAPQKKKELQVFLTLRVIDELADSSG